MKRPYYSLLVIAGSAWVLLLATGAAVADIVPLGDPINGSSWGQRFVFSADCQVDMLGAGIVDGGPFTPNAFRAFDVPGWQIIGESPSQAPELAFAGTTSNPVSQLGFQLWFDAELAEPLTFLLAAWQPGKSQPCEAYRLTWLGFSSFAKDCVWVIEEDPDWNPMIPAPGAVLLGLVGVGCMNAVRRWLS